MNKIDEIEQISERKLRVDSIIKYALYSTLSYDEIILNLKNNYTKINIRDKLLNQLNRKYKEERYEELFKFLIAEYEKADGVKKRSIGKIFTVLNENLEIKDREKIFSISIKSEMPSIRKKAYEQAYYIYESKSIKKDLIDNWEKYQDIEILKILIAKDDYDYLYNNFENIWNNENISIKLKHTITNNLGKYNKSILPKIKEKDLITYMSASYYTKDLDFLKIIKDIMNSSKSIGELSYCIWILGQFGLYESIINLIPHIKEIEKITNSWSRFGYVTVLAYARTRAI